jgi:hypothetical protein
VLDSVPASDMHVLQLAEEEPREVEVVHGILEQPVAHVEPVCERAHRPGERAHRQFPELGFARELLRQAIGAREPLHVTHDAGNAGLSRFRCETGGLGRVVCRGLFRKDGNPSADACPNDARELVGRHDDDDAVESDRVEHPLDVVECCFRPEPRRGGFGPIEVPCAGRRERHARAREVREDGGQRVAADSDNSDAHRFGVTVGHSFS